MSKHLEEAYEALICKLKDDLKKANSLVDYESDRNALREQAYAKFIYEHCGKKAVMSAAALADIADMDYTGNKCSPGCADWADCEFPDGGKS